MTSLAIQLCCTPDLPIFTVKAQRFIKSMKLDDVSVTVLMSASPPLREFSQRLLTLGSWQRNTPTILLNPPVWEAGRHTL